MNKSYFLTFIASISTEQLVEILLSDDGMLIAGTILVHGILISFIISAVLLSIFYKENHKISQIKIQNLMTYIIGCLIGSLILNSTKQFNNDYLQYDYYFVSFLIGIVIGWEIFIYVDNRIKKKINA